MSIIGTYGLNRFADEMEITSPSEMLYHLNTLFEESFKQKEGAEIFDGMDIALCSYNPKTKELIYAGANIALFILRESNQVQPSRTIAAKGVTHTLFNIKPNKQPIGSYFDKKPFVNHSIDLMENDVVYLFSDGFYDQFGGPDGRKYKSAQLYKLLCSIGDKPLESQKLILEETFIEWKGSRNQLDDVTLMGIKI
jgi:serine phosphatase RsbU (regulator of sigma subunit)